jgi:hypothetical protein
MRQARTQIRDNSVLTRPRRRYISRFSWFNPVSSGKYHSSTATKGTTALSYIRIHLPVSQSLSTMRVYSNLSNRLKGRAVAQAVSRWLPTAAARVRVRAEYVGFVVDKAALEQVFSGYFGFPPPIIIPPISPSSQSQGAGTIVLLVAAVPSGPNWNPPSTISIKKISNRFN